MIEPPRETPVELPRAQERLAVAALSLAAFALNLNTNVLGALLPFVHAELALHDGQEAYLVAAAAAGSAVGALAVGPLSARHGRRAVLVGGLLGFVAASLAHLLAASFWPFLAMRLVAGLAVGVAYAAASALVADIAPYARRGAAMGRFTAGMFLAIAVGMPAAVWFASIGMWPLIFVAQAGVGALGCWWAMRAVPPSPPVEVHGSMLAPLRSGAVVAGLVATMLHVGSFFTTVQLATTWLDETGRVAKADQIWVWVGLGFASVLGSAMLGRFSDRIGKRAFVLATSVVLVGCFGVMAREPAQGLLLGTGSVLAVTAAARTGPLQALVSGLVPQGQLGALMGLRGFVMQAGVVAFALIASVLVRDLGFRGVLVFAAACQLSSYVAIRFWVREAK